MGGMRIPIAIVLGAVALVSCKGDQTSGAEAGRPRLAAQDANSKTATGRVQSVQATEIVLDIDTPHTLAIDGQTAIVLDGQKAVAIDLPPGTEVRASYVLGPDGKAKALAVEAVSKRGVGTNAATPPGQPKAQ